MSSLDTVPAPLCEEPSSSVRMERFSPAAMADAIAGLLADPEQRARIGAREQERVVTVNAPGRISGLMYGEFASLATGGVQTRSGS